MDKQAHEILMAARVKAMVARPYFSRALCAVKLTEKPGIGTMACDPYWRVYYDPVTVRMWGVADTAVGLLHEISHLLQRHHARAKAMGVTNADHERANIAQDCAINGCLLHSEDRGLKLLATDLVPAKYKLPAGLTWEEYFALLQQQQQAQSKPQNGQGTPRNCGSGATGVPQPWEDAPPVEGEDGGEGGLTPVEVLGVISATAAAVREASKSRGSVPGAWATWAGGVDAKPQVRWQTVLQRAVRSAVRYVAGANDYTYSRPSRRANPASTLVMPALRSPIVNVAAIVDTSASMAHGDTRAALAEVAAVCKLVGTPVRVLSVDAAVHSDQAVTSVRQVKVLGGGGTSMNAGIRHVVKTRRQQPVDVLIVLTDGGTDFPSRADVPRDVHLIYVLIGRDAEGARPSVPAWAQAVVVSAA